MFPVAGGGAFPDGEGLVADALRKRSDEANHQNPSPDDKPGWVFLFVLSKQAGGRFDEVEPPAKSVVFAGGYLTRITSTT